LRNSNKFYEGNFVIFKLHHGYDFSYFNFNLNLPPSLILILIFIILHTFV